MFLRPRSRGTAAALMALMALLVLAVASLTACSGDDAASSSAPTPTEVLADAREKLDETSGVRLGLRTEDLPAGVTGVQEAKGIGTHAPAFDGTITVVLSGQAFEVPVVAVDGKVHVQLPLTTGWQAIDPADYGAPDPAQLMSTDDGLSSLLTASTDVRKGDSVRGGEGNKEVLTEYSATVPGAAVAHVIPTASGPFAATYTVSDAGQLRQARLTGAFYPKAAPMTYTVTFDDYGTDKDITAP